MHYLIRTLTKNSECILHISFCFLIVLYVKARHAQVQLFTLPEYCPTFTVPKKEEKNYTTTRLIFLHLFLVHLFRFICFLFLKEFFHFFEILSFHFFVSFFVTFLGERLRKKINVRIKSVLQRTERTDFYTDMIETLR